MILSDYICEEKSTIPHKSTSPRTNSYSTSYEWTKPGLFLTAQSSALSGLGGYSRWGDVESSNTECTKAAEPSPSEQDTPRGTYGNKESKPTLTHSEDWALFFLEKRSAAAVLRVFTLALDCSPWAALPYSWAKGFWMLRMQEVSLAQGQDSAHCWPGEKYTSWSVCWTENQNGGGYGATAYTGCSAECHCCFVGRVGRHRCCLCVEDLQRDTSVLCKFISLWCPDSVNEQGLYDTCGLCDLSGLSDICLSSK